MMEQWEAQRRLQPMSEKRVKTRNEPMDSLMRIYSHDLDSHRLHPNWPHPGRDPREMLENLQQLLGRRDIGGINGFVRQKGMNTGTRTLIHNEIIGQLERNPDDRELSQLVENLYGNIRVFFGTIDVVMEFEPQKDVPVIIRATCPPLSQQLIDQVRAKAERSWKPTPKPEEMPIPPGVESWD
jgi:hypothetical protein